MKNSNLFKKFAAIVVSAMMVLSTLAVPTFAADETTTLTISGVTNAKAVEGFKIVERDITDNSWKMVDDYGGKGNDGKFYVKDAEGALTDVEYDINSPSATAINAIATLVGSKAVDTTKGDITFTKNEAKYENTGNAVGTWYVRVTANDAGTIYNPMLVSRTSSEAKGLTSENAAAKQSDIPFNKVVERKSGVAAGTNLDNDKVTGDALDQNPSGDDASADDGDFDTENDGNKGDTAGSKSTNENFIKYDSDTKKVTIDNANTVYDDVQFRINTKVPKYSENYFNASEKPEFVVYDTLSNGLTFNVDSLKVKVGNDVITESNDNVTIKKNTDGKTFTVSFTEAGLKKYKNGEAVEITYTAKLNKDHGVNFDAETNTAELWYTRNPGEGKKKGGEETTYHYTFEINGNVDKMAKEENREVIKVGIDKTGQPQFKEETVAVKDDAWTPLAGVEFELQDASGNVVKKVVTDKDGILRGMTQLDAGAYKLVEKKLPAEYSQYKINNNPIDVVIDAKLDSVGRLESYKVTVGDIVVGNYKKDYTNKKIEFLDKDGNKVAEMPCEGNDAGVVTNVGNVARHEFTKAGTTYKDTDKEAVDIINSSVGTLPSTGGMGTVIFTVGGIAIMALAIFLLFGGKKKKEQE